MEIIAKSGAESVRAFPAKPISETDENQFITNDEAACSRLLERGFEVF